MKVQRLLRIPLAISGLWMLSGCGPAQESEEFIEDSEDALSGTFLMKAVHSSKCVDVQSASTANGANLQQWTCHGRANQQWKFVDKGNGIHEIVSVNSGKCMDVREFSTVNGGRIQQWDCSGKNNQRWRLESLGSGQYRVRSVYSGKCLDIAGRSTADGAALQQWSCVDVPNQRFTLSAVSGGSTGGSTTTTTTCPAWQAGKWYNAGDKVTYNGSAYVAEHDNPGYDPVISTWYWEPTTGCSSTSTGGTTGGGGGTTTTSGVSSLITSSQFNQIFPNRNPFYTYDGLINATKSYSAFGTTGDTATRKREIAAFLANTAHETGNLVYIEEINKAPYCSSSSSCPCESGKWYFGRGPIQLSWNYNYCAAGAALGLNLRADPDLVARSATVAWQTGLWFWMTSTGAGSMTGHQAMTGSTPRFGETIRTINGALECGGRSPGSVQSRIDSYTRICGILGVDPGGNLYC